MTPENILRILETAVYAPSGDNAQPWRFSIRDGRVFVFNVPDSDPTLYNFRQRGSYVAHGALLENIAIAAAKDGYVTGIREFPGETDCVASVAFTKGTADAALYEHIQRRTTNRKPYAQRPLEAAHKDALVRAGKSHPGVELRIVEDAALLENIAQAVAVNERILMENQYLHDALFAMLRYSKEDELAHPGLYIKTMELPPPVEFLFRTLLPHWPLVRALNVLGFARSIPRQNAPLYSACSAICAIALTDESDADFLRAGRVMQRIWLTAQACGLSVHPLAAIPYLAQRVQAGEARMFSPEHTQLIRDSYAAIIGAFSLTEGTIAMQLRIGYGEPPTATSSKRAPIIDA